jgi:hypothetical protein
VGDRGDEAADLAARSKLTLRRDEHGQWVTAQPTPRSTPTVEAAERPPTPDDGVVYFTRYGSDAG